MSNLITNSDKFLSFPSSKMKKYHGVGIAILNTAGDCVLMIRDSRSQKWSFPKGRVESFDAFPLATGIREVAEETNFHYKRDYLVDVDKKGIYGSYLLYEGNALRETLVSTSKREEFVDEIAWISLNNLGELTKNYPTRRYCEAHGWTAKLVAGL